MAKASDKAPQSGAKKKSKSKEPPHLLRGMRDVLPEESRFWTFLEGIVRRTAAQYGYERIHTPVLEQKHLFLRSLGEGSDVLQKELFEFEDKSGEEVALKPEMTAPVVRAYVEHGMLNLPQPVKLFYWEPLFRYDRPQAGRYRQHTQFGFESIGDAHPVIDAQLILIVTHIFSDAGITPSIQVNSIGDEQCRPEYIKALQEYYRSRRNHLCEDCKVRIKTNPLRMLDCKEPDCRELANLAPQIVDHLCEPCRTHFEAVLGHLDDMDVSYTLNAKLVRGFDYYTRTVFEAWPTEAEEGAQSALGGGGRYNRLVEELGGREDTPAIGFACGVERTVRRMRELNVAPKDETHAPLFIAQLGDEARKRAITLFEQLRAEGVPAREELSKDGLKQQLELANRVQAEYALIIGQKEIVDGTVLIRDMENGIQETVAFDRVIPEVTKRLRARGLIAPQPPAAEAPPEQESPNA
jgi:histidyl-tRNA synthetase